MVFLYFSHRKTELTSGVVVASIILSSFLTSLSKIIFPDLSGRLFILVNLTLSTALGFFFAMLIKSIRIQKIWRLAFKQTINENIWVDVIDTNNGTLACVVRGNKSFYGDVLYKDTGDDSWIVLKNYRIVVDGREEPKSTDYRSTILLDLKSSDYVEFYYPWESDLLNR